MSTRPSRAERLDHAVDAVLAGAPAQIAAAAASVAPDDRPLVDAAATLRASTRSSRPSS